MTVAHSFKTALKGLRANRSRSALTILGIVIGITAIIVVMSVGAGAENLIIAQIQGLGTKTFVVIPGREPTGPSDFGQLFSESLKERDLATLLRKENTPSVAEIMPVVFGAETVGYGSETYRATIIGATERASDIFDLLPEAGAFIGEEDVRGRADVAVIGAKAKEELFGESDAVGERVKVKGRNLRIIGVLPQKGQVSFFNFDEMLVVPYTTAQQYIFGIKHFHRFIVEAASEAEIPAAVADVGETLRLSHGITDSAKDDFFIQTQDDITSRLGTVTSVLTVLLVSIAAISLVVGGIGIMNIMLVSVTERTREIGLRKAIGATERNILTQFLLEAVMLTAIGGIIGIIGGAVLSLATSVALSRFVGLGWFFTFPISAALLGLGVSTAVGIIFGLYPARRAAALNPIDALRYE